MEKKVEEVNNSINRDKTQTCSWIGLLLIFVKIDSNKIKWSPRFVHFDECLLLAESGDIQIRGKNSFGWAKELFWKINGQSISGIDKFVISDKEGSDNV